MSLVHNGLTVTEHVALHSDGTREFDYTLEDAILPRNIVLAILGIDIQAKIGPFATDYNFYTSAMQEIFNGSSWTMRVVDQCNTFYESERYKFVFTLTEDKKQLYYTGKWKFDNIYVPIIKNSWTIDELDSIDAINWEATQCLDDLIGVHND